MMFLINLRYRFIYGRFWIVLIVCGILGSFRKKCKIRYFGIFWIYVKGKMSYENYKWAKGILRGFGDEVGVVYWGGFFCVYSENRNIFCIIFFILFVEV